MASPSTINKWTQDLVNLLLPGSETNISRVPRRHLETFRRRLKHHNFARTNQFDVDDRLNGLEEKFQILNRDDLSDAIYDRRDELQEHHQQWIPDVLDLLLRLSGNPVQVTKSLYLSGAAQIGEAASYLELVDVDAENLRDLDDPIWKIPVFSDLSSDEDEAEIATPLTSPASIKHKAHDAQSLSAQLSKNIFGGDVAETAPALTKCLRSSPANGDLTIPEVYLIRQCLVVVQGFPSGIFEIVDQCIQLKLGLRTEALSNTTLRALLRTLVLIRMQVNMVKTWLAQDQKEDFMQAIRHSVEGGLHRFTLLISAMEEDLLQPRLMSTVSLLFITDRVEEAGRPLRLFTQWITSTRNLDAISCLNTMYDMISQHEFANNEVGARVMLPTFLDALRAYFRPIQMWLTRGVLDTQQQPFFVKPRPNNCAVSDLWHDHYELDEGGPHRAPAFLQQLAPRIFTCGKTIALANRISEDVSEALIPESYFTSFLHSLHILASDLAIPFPVALLDAVNQLLSQSLANATLRLRSLLETHCRFTQTLDAFEYIYLHKNGVLLDAFESRVFDRVDRCMNDWNDRFLAADMLQGIYKGVCCIDLDSIIVQAARTSSRSMESRRRSVRILGALAVDYALPWPIANIIPKTSLNAYRRVALHLFQIRRSKYVLERIAYVQVTTASIGETPRDQVFVQATTFMLIQFINTLYDHFTTGLILPMTIRMRNDLRQANSVDEMINVHVDYITHLDSTCLVSKQLKVIRETLVGLLDMCIKFADLVSSNTHSSTRRGSDDFETSSFMSAQSQRRNRRPKRARTQAYDLDDSFDESDDDELGNEGEGYSSFIVLGDDTSLMQEIRKLQVQFRRQLDFFIAGLRGIGRGGDSVEEFEKLADRLDWRSGPST